jgi:hypothetical protein
LFHTEYTGATLRENYGLPRPKSRFAQAQITPSFASAAISLSDIRSSSP